MKIDEYLILLLKGGKSMKIPSVRFWAMTLLVVGAGLEIRMNNGHFLTTEDCYVEMNDCAEGDCYRNSCPIKHWLRQRRKYFGSL